MAAWDKSKRLQFKSKRGQLGGWPFFLCIGFIFPFALVSFFPLHWLHLRPPDGSSDVAEFRSRNHACAASRGA